MATADFYIGIDRDAEWLGGIATNGDPGWVVGYLEPPSPVLTYREVARVAACTASVPVRTGAPHEPWAFSEQAFRRAVYEIMAEGDPRRPPQNDSTWATATRHRWQYAFHLKAVYLYLDGYMYGRVHPNLSSTRAPLPGLAASILTEPDQRLAADMADYLNHT